MPDRIHSKAVKGMDNRFYPQVTSNWDDALLRNQVQRRSDAAHRMLDLGAGAGIVSEMDLRDVRRSVHGCDIDPRIAENTLVNHGCRADAEMLPYLSETFDVVVADNVLEHLDRPERVFREVFRVLRPGGLFHFKTPNRRHYVPTLARLTPGWVHKKVAGWRGRAAEDTFETHYRANTARDLAGFAMTSGFEIVECRFVESRPEYCRLNPALYACGIAYERLVNSSEAFARLRVIILGTLRKPAAQ